MSNLSKRRAERETLKAVLETESFGDRKVNYSGAKLDLLFDLAWEYGHSSGESDVRHYYGDLVGLVL